MKNDPKTIAVEKAATDIFGSSAPVWCWPCAEVARLLEEAHSFNPYGYFRFLLRSMGGKALFKNVQTSPTMIKKFKDAYQEEVRLFAERLTNTHTVMHRTLTQGASIPITLGVCEFHPAALYLLLRAIDCPQYAAPYREDALEYFKCWPDVLKTQVALKYALKVGGLTNG